MSFLAKYWYAVERAVADTGMNPGDVHVNISELLNNTQPSNVVDTDPAVNQTTNNRPLEDGDMSRYATDFAAREARARGSARSGQDGSTMDEPEIRKAKGRNDKSPDGKPGREEGGVHAKTKTQAKADRKLKRKLLKKLGTGRNVRVKLSEVHVNGTKVWDEPQV